MRTALIGMIAAMVMLGCLGRHEERPLSRGLIANAGAEGRRVKAALYFAGAKNPIFHKHDVQTPTSMGDMATDLDNIRDLGCNAILYSFWGSDGEEKAFSTALTSPDVVRRLHEACARRELFIAPFIEVHARNKFGEYFPATIDDLTARIGWTLEQFGTSPHWIRIVDRAGHPRLAVWLIETVSMDPGMDPTRFAAGFDALATRFKQRHGLDVGFVIDPTRLPADDRLLPFGVSPEILAATDAVLAVNPYHVTVNGKTESERLAHQEMLYRRWKACGIPLYFQLEPGYRSAFFPEGGSYGHNAAWYEREAAMAREFAVHGLTGVYNLPTEDIDLEPTREGDDDFRWAKGIFTRSP